MKQISNLFVASLALFLLIAEPALAQSIDLSPIQSLLQGIVDALTGPLGVVIATLAVLGVFLSWFFNIIDLRQALWVLVGIAGVAAAPTIVAAVYLLSQPEEEEALPTATPDVFQNEGDGFGAIETLPPPEPEVVLVAPEPVEPNAELLAQLAALQAQIEELRNAPEPVVEEDTAAAEAIDALTTQIAALQAASEAAQQQFRDELTARDRELEQIRMDLELAQLEANRPLPAPVGPTEDELRAREEERLRREEEARRLAELERRAAEERAFQERRIASPTIAFGGASGANETALTERTFGEVTDFVLNGALSKAPSASSRR
jgi:type IV secretion system protein VirB10